MQKRFFLSCRWIFPAIFVLVLVSGAFSQAQAAPFFKGKVIRFVVPYSPGGGTDVFARLLAKNLKRHIPGNPGIVVRNMPGGGSVIGGNFAWAARPDGKTVLVTSGSTVMTNILRPSGVKYKLQEMHALYSAPIGNVYFTSLKSIKEPIDIMTAKGIIFGHIAPAGGTGGGFAWARALLKFKAKEIWGYGGSGSARLAYLSGELNTGGGSTLDFNASMIPFVKKGEATPIYQSGILDENGEIVREPAAPDIPTPVELYERFYGKKPSGPFLDAYKLIVGSRTYGKCLNLHRKVPAKIVAIYRKAVADMVKDPKFLKESGRLLPQAPHFYGKGLIKSYPAGVSGPPETIKFMKNYLIKQYNMAFD